ncbi:MAG: PaaI family thioesterase [Actinomycetota bacterium]|nr:PaaI family thioesterase [Actinomycetota bacterium]
MVSESARAARVQAVLDIPLHRFLGVRLLDPGDPAAGISFPVGEAAQNQAAVLHGGVVTALLDVASYLALLPHLDDAEHAVTHDLSVSLLRPVGADERVAVVGGVLRRGRALAFLRAEATVEGRTVAAAQVTKSIVPVPGTGGRRDERL